MRQDVTGPIARSQARWAAFVAAVSLAFWAVLLLGDLRTRAFDQSDPNEQMYNANAAAQAFRTQGPIPWMAALVSDDLAKPAHKGFLSLGILAGAGADDAGYMLLSALVTLALLGLVLWVVWRTLGLTAMAALAVFFSSSGVVLGQAYYGGHSWLGQLFVWAGLALGGGRESSKGRRLGRDFALGLSLGLAFLASYHMVPFIGMLLAVWVWGFGVESVESRRVGWRPPLALAAGSACVLFLLESCTFSVPKKHYWEALNYIVHRATDVDTAAKSIHAYFFKMLASCESRWLLAVVGPCWAAGCWRLVERFRRGEKELAALAFTPLAAYAFLELPGVLRLGRVYLPLLIFVFVQAAEGATWLLGLVRDVRLRVAAGAAAAMVVFTAGAGPRLELWSAFHAGRIIDRVMRERGGGGTFIVVGESIPYRYRGARELRRKFMRDLVIAAPTGEEWVLVSYLSNWFWHGFQDAGTFDIPVRKVYASPEPFVAVPGVESDPFQRFTNDALFLKVARGEIPFPVPNRLYKARDFLRACSGP